ncbi:MAG: hypothetical protein ACK5SI_14445, partial [Planctomycetia bacterium]
MKRTWLWCVLALAGMVSWGTSAEAGYCGLASFRHAGPRVTAVGFAEARAGCSACESGAEAPACGTRLVKDVVYEQQEYTCYKTICERVVEQREIDCVRYETERSFKEVEYTVSRPVWETRSRTVNYTVCKPVWETITR